jgi:hypothetical protein
MSKILNTLNKTTLAAVPGAPAIGPSTYEPSTPRVAFGFAGAAMTVITIAVSVILPAHMDSGSREARMLAASKETAPAPVGLAAVTSTDVVAIRELGSSTVQLRIEEAASQPGRLGKTTSPAVVRVSSTGH